ncbi:MAG: nuclear transport factor 2 family protein, partial [Solirubrobacterales bacterium]
ATERWIADEGELLPLPAQLEGTSYRGPGGLRRFWADLNADWADLRLTIDELRESGDVVILIGRFTARGRVSGIELDVRIGTVWELRDGKVMRMESFSDPDEALRAAGLADS